MPTQLRPQAAKDFAKLGGLQMDGFDDRFSPRSIRWGPTRRVSFLRTLLSGTARLLIVFGSLAGAAEAQTPQQTAAIPDVVAANPSVSQYPEAFELNPTTHAVYVMNENDPYGGFTGSLLYIDGSQLTPVANPADACLNNNGVPAIAVYAPSNELFYATYIPVENVTSAFNEVSGVLGSCPPDPADVSVPIVVGGVAAVFDEEAPGMATDPTLGKVYVGAAFDTLNGGPQLAILDIATSTFESYAPALYGTPGGDPYASDGSPSTIALDDTGPNPSHLVFETENNGDEGTNQVFAIDPTGSVAKEVAVTGFSGIPFVFPATTPTGSGQLALVTPTQIDVFNISDFVAYLAGGATPAAVGSGTFDASLLGGAPSSVSFTEPVLDPVNGVVYGDLSGSITGDDIPESILLSVSLAGLPSGPNSSTPVGVEVGPLDLFDQTGLAGGGIYPYTLALTANPADSQHPFIYAWSVGDYTGEAGDPNLTGIQLFNTASSTVSTIPLTAPCALGLATPVCPLKPQGVDLTGYSPVFVTDPGNNSLYLRGVLTDSETREPDYYIAVVQIPAAEPPSLTSPSTSPLAGATTFTWNPGAGSSMFALWIGTAPGTYNLYTSGHVANTFTSETVNIPADGATLYVSLWYEKNGTWSDTAYTFTEAAPPSLTSPSSSPLAGATTFTWNPGAGSTMFALWIGTSPGTNNFYTSGHVASAVTSETVNIPANGATLYVSLWYEMNGYWTDKSYTFTEAQVPSLTSPTASPLSGSTQFTWNPGTGSTMFALWIGTAEGTSNLYTSGHIANAVTSETVNIPADGATLYVTLWYEVSGIWSDTAYTFTEATPPSLTSPTSSPLSGTTQFNWSPGTGSTMFALWIGTTAETNNLYTSGHVASTVTSETVNIPANGATLYVSLWYELNGNWTYKSYTFTEAP